MDEYRALRRLFHCVAGVLPLAVGRYRHDRAYRAYGAYGRYRRDGA